MVFVRATLLVLDVIPTLIVSIVFLSLRLILTYMTFKFNFHKISFHVFYRTYVISRFYRKISDDFVGYGIFPVIPSNDLFA